MGYLAIVLAVLSVAHSVTVAVRENGIHASLGLGPRLHRANQINGFWATGYGLAALALGIVAWVT